MSDFLSHPPLISTVVWLLFALSGGMLCRVSGFVQSIFQHLDSKSFPPRFDYVSKFTQIKTPWEYLVNMFHVSTEGKSRIDIAKQLQAVLNEFLKLQCVVGGRIEAAFMRMLADLHEKPLVIFRFLSNELFLSGRLYYSYHRNLHGLHADFEAPLFLLGYYPNAPNQVRSSFPSRHVAIKVKGMVSTTYLLLFPCVIALCDCM